MSLHTHPNHTNLIVPLRSHIYEKFIDMNMMSHNHKIYNNNNSVNLKECHINWTLYKQRIKLKPQKNLKIVNCVPKFLIFRNIDKTLKRNASSIWFSGRFLSRFSALIYIKKSFKFLPVLGDQTVFP